MACNSEFKGPWERHIARMSDHELTKTANNVENWYIHSQADHRLYMRLVKHEAHRRGLGT